MKIKIKLFYFSFHYYNSKIQQTTSSNKPSAWAADGLLGQPPSTPLKPLALHCGWASLHLFSLWWSLLFEWATAGSLKMVWWEWFHSFPQTTASHFNQREEQYAQAQAGTAGCLSGQSSSAEEERALWWREALAPFWRSIKLIYSIHFRNPVAVEWWN